MSDLPTSLCPNCESPHVQRFCPVCGQENTPSALPLHHVIKDVLEEFLKFDAKLWTTLATLMREPGRITREYLQGRRARWASPIKLYVSLIFVQAVLSTFLPRQFATDLSHQVTGLRQGDTMLSNLLPWWTAPRTAPVEPLEDTDRDDPEARTHLKNCQDVLDKQQKDAQDRSRRAWLTGNTTTVALLRIPLYALLFALFHKRQRRYYIEHVIFALHLLSAAALIELAGDLGGALKIPLAGTAAICGTLFYAYRASHCVYDERRGRTIAVVVGFLVLGVLIEQLAGVGAGIIYRLTPRE